MNLSLFDLHCDTACEMFAKKQGLERNHLAISLESTANFGQYIQVMAFWTDFRLNDESGWTRMKQLRENLLSDPAVRSGKVDCVTACPPRNGKPALLFGIEDARIFANDLGRVDEAYRLGIRILTPLWAGETCIGGSHDTSAGLTDFGRSAIDRAVFLGMIPDLSHASEPSANEIIEIAAKHGRPVIASHSNAKAVCPVSRNLSDGQIRKILASGGVVGLNLYTKFLCGSGSARISDLLPHVEHFLELGAERALCFGGDWDGAALPSEVRTAADVAQVAELLLRRNYSESLIRNLFFENAYSFASRYLAGGNRKIEPFGGTER